MHLGDKDAAPLLLSLENNQSLKVRLFATMLVRKGQHLASDVRR